MQDAAAESKLRTVPLGLLLPIGLPRPVRILPEKKQYSLFALYNRTVAIMISHIVFLLLIPRQQHECLTTYGPLGKSGHIK